MHLFDEIVSYIPLPYDLASNLLKISGLTLIIITYALFIFYSYKLFSKKNLFKFNFREFLESSNRTVSSISGFFLYILEYIIILPFFVAIWFAFYSVFLLVLAKNLEIETILMVCTALIASIRISSFTSYSLAQDLAKMLPFTFLALAITGERFFSLDLILERVGDIPTLLYSIPIYLLFVFIIETIFRLVDGIRIFIFRDKETTNP